MAPYQFPELSDLSHELLCHILQYLPLKEVLSISMLCKKLSIAVDMHLRLRKYVDFCEGQLYGYMSPTITDEHMHFLFKKCPHLETVYGLHPLKVERRRLRKRTALTVPGILEALSLCCNLKAVETSDLRLFEAIMQNLPKIEIIGHFRNRDGVFPPHASQRLKLQPYPRISSLHLIGVEIPELTAMPRLEHLHLQCVRFTKLQPFRAFLAQNLKTFVMKHCMGPTLALRYLSLIIALSSSPSLSRLELVRVPLPGGLFQRAVEDSYRHNGFVNLKTIVISGCKGVMEADVGHLMIVASKNLEAIFIQPSLTRDSLFVSLSFAHCEFPKLKSIHLGHVDNLNTPGEFSNDALLSLGLAEIPDTPSSLTDSGMKVISQLFPSIKSMSVSNCPHLMAMDQWSENGEGGEPSWRELTDLTLQRCHCLQLSTFALFVAFLPKIEVVLLNDMFREPPKGCSHVGLSAGTGLGMSSAVVSNQDEHIAVQGHQQDFELPAEEPVENDEVDRELVEADHEENPDQHIMVLQQEFFDDERRIVPPPVRHREDIGPENMPQNDPENRIRRELNDDYDVALNLDILQVGEVSEDQVPREGVKESSDEDSKPENVPLINEESSDQPGGKDWSKVSPEEEDSKPECIPLNDESSNQVDVGDLGKNLQMSAEQGINVKDELSGSSEPSSNEKEAKSNDLSSSNQVSNPKVIAVTNNKCSDNTTCHSEEKILAKQLPSSSKGKSLVTDASMEEDKPMKTEKDVRKKIGDHDKKCHISHGCKKKCSKGFDPNQPSTSRDGNCLDCSCVGEVDPEAKDNSSKNNNKISSIEVVPSTKRKSSRLANGSIKKHCKSSDPIGKSLCNESYPDDKKKQDNEFDFDDEAFEGPVTRHRKRVLDSDLKKESSVHCNKKLKSSAQKNPIRCDTSSTSNVSSEPPEDIEAKKDAESKDNESKKHKNHMHMRCRKNQCDKPGHRRYPLTRSRRNRIVRDGYNIVSQGTQATSADIRRALRKQRVCSNRCKRRTCGGSHRRSHNHISARQQFKRPIQRKSNSELRNKSTSTSDPLMEDDAIQVLRLVSESLISVTIIACGISDVVIDHCQSLTHIEVQACRILKMVQLHYCPSLKRLNVSQCPKVGLDSIIPEVVLLVATRRLLISFEPCMQIYNPAASEKAIFSRTSLEQSVILFHDFTSTANESLQAVAKENLFRWMEVVQKLYYSPFWLSRQRKKKIKTRESKSRYPYGHNLRRIHGVFTLPASVDPDGTEWRYQILTNDHVFASALESVPWDNGFPAPESAFTEGDALISMIETEFTEKKLKMRKKMMSFYIPVSESNLLTD